MSHTSEDHQADFFDALSHIADVSQKWMKREKTTTPVRAFVECQRVRTPQETESILHKRLHRVAVREVSKALKLERCAIIQRHSDRDGFWTINEHLGVPERILSESFYSRGEGLTGRVLLGELVVSSNILADKRHSSRYSNQWILKDGTIDPENTPRAYVGAPLWRQRTEYEQDPVGAVYAIRSKREFSAQEVAFVRLAAQLVSFGHDRLRSWRRRAESDVRQLRMSKLWQSSASEKYKYEEILHILREEFPFPRLLLSIFDENKRRMLGVAAIGFRSDIITETNRPVPREPTTTSTPSYAEEAEDILAMMYRLQSTMPRIVAPADADWVKVNRVTAFRHQVRNPLLLVPLMSSAGPVLGVLLAELPTDTVPLGPNELERLSLFANHVAHQIELHRRQNELKSVSITWERIHDTLFQYRGNDDRPEALATLNAITQIICNHTKIGPAAVYHLNEKDHALHGVTGVGISESVVRQHFISLDEQRSISDASPLALEAIRRGRNICRPSRLTAGLATPNDHSVLAGLDGGAGTCVNAIPLFDGAGCNGVFLFGDREVNSQCAGAEILHQFTPVLGHCLSLLHLHERVRSAESASSAFQSLAFAINEIGRLDGKTNASQTTEVATQSVLRDTAVMFDSALAQLFLFEEPIRLLPDVNMSAASHVRGKQLVERGRYLEGHLPASFHGRVILEQREPRIIEIDSSLGLTSSIVKSVSVVHTPDVERDPFWSQRSIELSGCRAFLGLPLIAEWQGTTTLYGALTLTRLRMAPNDSRAFRFEEIHTAKNIAALIAAAFQRSQQVEDERSAAKEEKERATEVRVRVNRCLGWFRHDIPYLITNIEREVSLFVKESSHLGTGESAQKQILGGHDLQLLAEATRSVCVACALALGERRADSSSPQLEPREQRAHSIKSGNLRDLEKQVLLLIRAEANNLGDTVIWPFELPNDPMIDGELMTPLMYVCYAIVRNAVIACKYNQINTTHDEPGNVYVRIGVKADQLVLEVADDGGGTRGASWAQLSQELHSGWAVTHDGCRPGTGSHHGMGLHIVDRIVSEHLLGTTSVTDICHDNGRKGARFQVELRFLEKNGVDVQRVTG